MSQRLERPSATGIEARIGEHAEAFDRAAATADDPAGADACAVLAALARGRTPPEAPSRRVWRRAEEGER